MKNLNVTKEVVNRFAEAAETIIVAKSKLSKELTRFIQEHQFMIEADAREQNPCAVENLETAICWVEFYQSNLDYLVDVCLNEDGVYKITIPDTEKGLNAQIEYIDGTFREFLEEYESYIHYVQVLIARHMVSKLFREKIEETPEWRKQLDDLYSEINQATSDLVNLSSKHRFSIEPLERSVELCVKVEELGVLTPGSEKYLTISQEKKITFTDLLLQYLSRFA
ncbi:hypothetical protein JEO88_03555 [Candidatus Saccharibacteria bacterium]|nr:hypothetical protein [Candidatus Saccharibacteria bacterium]